MREPALYADLDSWLRSLGDGSYEVVLQFRPASSASEVDLAWGDLPRLWLDDAGLRELNLQPEAFGRRLSAAFFADEHLIGACRRAYDQAQPADSGRRMRLYLDPRDKALQRIRWELLCFPSCAGARNLATSQRILFSRYPSSGATPCASPRDLGPELAYAHLQEWYNRQGGAALPALCSRQHRCPP